MASGNDDNGVGGMDGVGGTADSEPHARAAHADGGGEGSASGEPQDDPNSSQIGSDGNYHGGNNVNGSGQGDECGPDDLPIAAGEEAGGSHPQASPGGALTGATLAEDPSVVLVDTTCNTLDQADNAVTATDDGPEDLHLSTLHHELNEVRSLLMNAQTTSAEELLRGIRSWESRPHADIEIVVVDSSLPVPLITAIKPAAEIAREANVEPADTGIVHGVVAFEDGVYRGQVRGSPHEPMMAGPDDAIAAPPVSPHGFGVVTSQDGLRRLGEWREGIQVGIGSLLSTVLTYDGEWRGSTPTGYGIGLFGFGCTFAGSWLNGRPHGLGRLQFPSENGEIRQQEGWFHGLTCLQTVAAADPLEDVRRNVQRLLPAANFDEQPQQGFFKVGIILETSRVGAYRRVFDQWRLLCADHAQRLAVRGRELSVASRIHALNAEECALAKELAGLVTAHRAEMGDVLDGVAHGRAQQARIQRIRVFHTNKLETAMFQRDLAQRCVIAQQESVQLMERELDEVNALLDEARQAQEDCRDYSHELQVLKRQIENTCVKVNALRHQMRAHDECSQGQAKGDTRLMTPQTPSNERGRDSMGLFAATADPSALNGLSYVCDVPGCGCGIPRDVFLRVAAVFNGD